MPTTAALRAAFRQETDEVFLIILDIDHPALADPIRVVNNSENIVSNGNTYVAFPFEIRLPDEAEDQPRVTLTIDNVDRVIVDTIRSLTTAPTVSISVILASSPNDIEVGPFVMTLREVTYDVMTVQGELTFDDVLNEPFPGDSFIPAHYPGLF